MVWVLDGERDVPRHLLWLFSCGDDNDSYLSNTSYGATAITVTCARGQVTVNPQTGRPAS